MMKILQACKKKKSLFKLIIFGVFLVFITVHNFYKSDHVTLPNRTEINTFAKLNTNLDNFNEKVNIYKFNTTGSKKNRLDGQLMNFSRRNLLNSEPFLVSTNNEKEYKIFIIEFHRVETPFIIGLWIFFASVAKIGKLFFCSTTYISLVVILA